jgi:hypothetical protein
LSSYSVKEYFKITLSSGESFKIKFLFIIDGLGDGNHMIKNVEIKGIEKISNHNYDVVIRSLDKFIDTSSDTGDIDTSSIESTLLNIAYDDTVEVLEKRGAKEYSTKDNENLLIVTLTSLNNKGIELLIDEIIEEMKIINRDSLEGKNEEDIKKIILGGLHYHLTQDNDRFTISLTESARSNIHHVPLFVNGEKPLRFFLIILKEVRELKKE